MEEVSILTKDNYQSGFLVDDELMGGVTKLSDQGYIGFVLRPETGEYLGYQKFSDLETALEALNQVKRTWQFEAAGGCGGGKCGSGNCDKNNCKLNSCGSCG